MADLGEGDDLSKGFEVIAPRIYGMNGFGIGGQPTTAEEYARFGNDFLDSLGIPPCHGAGHSWGAVSGFRMAASEESRLKTFVGLNPVLRNEHTLWSFTRAYFKILKNEGMLLGLAAPGFAFNAMIKPFKTLELIDSIIRFEYTEKVKVPSLAVISRADEFFPPDERTARELLATDLEFKVIPGRHMGPWRYPHRFAGEIRSHIQKHAVYVK